MRKKMVTAALIVLGGYAGVCGLACVSYRTFLYPAPGGVASGPNEHLLEATTSDGVKAHAYDFTEPGDQNVLVWFHGNGETAENGIDLASVFRARGIGSVFVEYRGYGASKESGKPNEPGLYADAVAVLDALDKKGFDKSKIVLLGYSLGTGVASEMAVRGRARAVVLVAPFTSIPAVAGRHVPILPTSLLIGDSFDTLSKAPKIDVPATVIHGTADGVVPFDMGEKVSKALPHATFLRIEGGGHADLFATAYDRLVEAIIARTLGA